MIKHVAQRQMLIRKQKLYKLLENSRGFMAWRHYCLYRRKGLEIKKEIKYTHHSAGVHCDLEGFLLDRE